MNTLRFRDEAPGDEKAIFDLTRAAFDGRSYADGNEADIVDALRDAGAIRMSLVAVCGEEIVGHLALSPVTIDDKPSRWLGLGPVSVLPARQSQGIGKALMHEALSRLRRQAVHGVVLLGDPGFYRRFGFETDTGLFMVGPPPQYFMALHLAGPPAKGRVRFHPVFRNTPRSA